MAATQAKEGALSGAAAAQEAAEAAGNGFCCDRQII
jgi:hypothetical protein